MDYFKPSGKWYMTEEIDMHGLWDVPDIFAAIREALTRHWRDGRSYERRNAWQHFTIIVLEPHHKYAHPVMLKAVES